MSGVRSWAACARGGHNAAATPAIAVDCKNCLRLGELAFGSFNRAPGGSSQTAEKRYRVTDEPGLGSGELRSPGQPRRLSPQKRWRKERALLPTQTRDRKSTRLTPVTVPSRMP